MPCTTETTLSPPLNLATQSGGVFSIERHESIVVGAIFVVIADSVEIGLRACRDGQIRLFEANPSFCVPFL
jgi:hypothetical protein